MIKKVPYNNKPYLIYFEDGDTGRMIFPAHLSLEEMRHFIERISGSKITALIAEENNYVK